MIQIPQHLRDFHHSATGEEGREWIARLPALIESCAEQWSLQVGEPFAGGNVAWVAPAQRFGHAVVLKVSFLDEETRYEAAALRLWNGGRTVRVLEFDESLGAILLERLTPGTPLASHPDTEEAVRIACRLLRDLWRPLSSPHPFREAADLAREFGFADLATGEECYLVNRDFHLGNVLLDNGEWKLIDPKPLAGERAFDTGHFLRTLVPPVFTREQVRELVELLAQELQLPGERIRRWALLRCLENAGWSGDPRDTALAAALEC